MGDLKIKIINTINKGIDEANKRLGTICFEKINEIALTNPNNKESDE